MLIDRLLGEFGDKKSPGVPRIPTPGAHATPQSLDHADPSDAMNYTGNDLEAAETEDDIMVSADEEKDVDPLDRFLPPPPKDKCSDALQVGSYFFWRNSFYCTTLRWKLII